MTLDLVLIGLTIACEPLPLTGYLLLLSSAGGTRKGLGFVIGWVVTLIGMVVITLALTGGKPVQQGTIPSTSALVVKILLGILLLWLAWRQRQHRGRPKSPPAWMARIDHTSVPAAIALGFLLQPWPLVAAGAASVMEADLSQTASVVALIVFCLLSTGSYLVMQIYATVAPGPAGIRLRALNRWIATHTDDIIIAASALIGLWLIARSVYELAT